MRVSVRRRYAGTCR